LQNYFQSNRFHYSTDVSDGDSKDVISKFLHDRSGYCVQFASTMALMARAVGIASRVAIGFTHGDRIADGTYEVTTFHAHAWPELYFDGIGWLTFEPTPRGDGQATLPAYTQNGRNSTTLGGPGANPTPEPNASASPNALGGDTGKLNRLGASDKTTGAPVAPASKHSFPTGVLLALVAAGLLLIGPAIGRWLTRRRRWAAAETDAARAHAAWQELADDARDLGIPWRSADSPRRAAERLVDTTDLVTAVPALQRLAAAEERARYARSLSDVGDLVADHKEVRRALAARASWVQRVAAVAMPRSTVATVVSATSNTVADVLDLIDTAIAWLGRVVVPRRLRRT
jgi:hypothetical protein